MTAPPEPVGLGGCHRARSAAASAPMQPGTSVAALDEPSMRVAAQHRRQGPRRRAEALLAEYAASLNYPKPAAATHVQAKDRFAEQVRANAKEPGQSLPTNATLTQKHAPQPKNTMAIALKDGGAVVFGLIERVDTIALKPSGKSLTPNASASSAEDADQRLGRDAHLRDRGLHGPEGGRGLAGRGGRGAGVGQGRAEQPHGEAESRL